MGIYLNPGNGSFEQAIRSKIYVDKTGLLEFTNEVLGTEQKNICVSRPRRFGKSMAANMLVAYYSARNYYSFIRELPTGKGFADIVFLPRKKYADKPAMIIELKWDKIAKGAIGQIKNKEYVSALEEYQGNLLLVGINYDKESKKHQCMIEKYIV